MNAKQLRQELEFKLEEVKLREVRFCAEYNSKDGAWGREKFRKEKENIETAIKMLDEINPAPITSLLALVKVTLEAARQSVYKRRPPSC